MASFNIINPEIPHEDFTMRISQSGDTVIANRSEYICNVAVMLFNMVPGTDDYNSNMGLNIGAKKFQPYTEGSRDSAYEAEIVKQFNTYTDLVPTNVIATFTKGHFTVLMSVELNGETYNVSVTVNDNNLTDVIAERVTNI